MLNRAQVLAHSISQFVSGISLASFASMRKLNNYVKLLAHSFLTFLLTLSMSFSASAQDTGLLSSGLTYSSSNVDVIEIQREAASGTYRAGQSLQTNPNLAPAEYIYKNGKVIGVKPGSASITISTLVDGVEKELTVDFSSYRPTEHGKLLEFSPEKIDQKNWKDWFKDQKSLAAAGFRKLSQTEIKDMAKYSLNAFQKGSVALAKGSADLVIKQFPQEAVKFYTAIFMQSLRQLIYTAPWEDPNPVTLKNFIDSLKSPTGYIGFLGFMAGNHGTAVMFKHLADLVSSDRPAKLVDTLRRLGPELVKHPLFGPHPDHTRRVAKDLLARDAAYRQKHSVSLISQNTRSQLMQGTKLTYGDRLSRVLMGAMGPIGMSVGMTTSMMIEEFAHDPGIKACSLLKLLRGKEEVPMKKLEKILHHIPISEEDMTELHARGSFSRSKTNQLAEQCENAYATWTAAHKLWQWFPHMAALTMAMKLSHGVGKALALGGRGGLSLGARGVEAGAGKLAAGLSTSWQTVGAGKHVRIMKAVLTQVRFAARVVRRNAFVAITPQANPFLFLMGQLGNFYLFLEASAALDTFVIRPWTTSRYAKSNLKNMNEISKLMAEFEKDPDYFAAYKEAKVAVKPDCRDGGVWDMLKKSFSSKCEFYGKDLLKRLKRYANSMTNFRQFLLMPMSAAMANWSSFLNGIASQFNNGTEFYPYAGSYLKDTPADENEIKPLDYFNSADPFYNLQDVHGDCGLAELNEETTAVDEYKKKFCVIAKAARSLGREIDSNRGVTHTDNPENHKHAKGGLAHEGTMLQLFHYFQAADMNVPFSQLLINRYKSLQISGATDEEKKADEIIKRAELTAEGMKLLYYIVSGDRPLYTTDQFLPPAQAVLDSYRIYDEEGHASHKTNAAELMRTGSATGNIYYKVFLGLGHPKPLQPGEVIIAKALDDQNVISPDSFDKHPKEYKGFATPTMADYLMVSMLCGPDSKLDYNSAIESVEGSIRWGYPDVSVKQDKDRALWNQYARAVRTKQFDKALDLYNQLEFKLRPSLMNRQYSRLFGFSINYAPPTIIAKEHLNTVKTYCQGGLQTVLKDRYAKPRIFEALFPVEDSGVIRPPSIERYRTFLDVLKAYKDPSIYTNPRTRAQTEDISAWWKSHAEPYTAAKMTYLHNQYVEILKRKLFKQIESDKDVGFLAKDFAHFTRDFPKQWNVFEKQYWGKVGRFLSGNMTHYEKISDLKVGLKESMKEEIRFLFNVARPLALEKLIQLGKDEAYQTETMDFYAAQETLLLEGIDELLARLDYDSTEEEFKEAQEKAFGALQVVAQVFWRGETNLLENMKFSAENDAKNREHVMTETIDFLRNLEGNDMNYMEQVNYQLMSRIFKIIDEAQGYRNMAIALKDLKDSLDKGK